MELDKKQIIDISPKISDKMAVFPGDRSFQRKVALSFASGDHLELSSVEHTLHLGAHADAPSHYHPDGKSIDEVSLSTYLGPCQVIDLSRRDFDQIGIKDLKGRTPLAPRVLFKTKSKHNFESWDPNFKSLTPELIPYLKDKWNCILVGIDTPSVDPAESKSLDSHKSIYKSEMAILEGLDLSQVNEGRYQLIALPLNLGGCEASPVRAVLIQA